MKPIATLCRVEPYERGETIFAQGDRGNKVYILKDSQVTSKRPVDVGDRTATVRITILGRGRAFGCWWALLEDAHSLMPLTTSSEEAEVVSREGLALRKALLQNLSTGFKRLKSPARMPGDRLRGAYGAMEKL